MIFMKGKFSGKYIEISNLSNCIILIENLADNLERSKN